MTIAALRRRRIRLGVRRDLPRYTRTRHPDRRLLHLAASILETTYRGLARRYPVVIVGPDLARSYRHVPRLCEMTVSLVRHRDIVDPEAPEPQPATGGLRLLSVERLDAEKNPLLLADVLAQLRRNDSRWELDVAGEGALADALAERLKELCVADHARLLGYVPVDQGLRDFYEQADVLLHVSSTEGLPQVLFEGFAAGTPIVATAVGCVPAAVSDAALLVEPGDAEVAAAVVERVVTELGLRQQLVRVGVERLLDQRWRRRPTGWWPS